MRLNRQQKAYVAIKEGTQLAFDYMKIGGGRASLEHRVVKPLDLAYNKAGEVILTAEDLGRQGKPRSFRIERAFHVQIV